MDRESKSLRGDRLVVGGDSLIGRAMVNRLKSMGVPVQYTSRRTASGSANYVYLDLVQSPTINLTPAVVYFCAGVTDLKLCEKFPLDTRRINVDATLELAAKLYARGAKIVYLSSHAVFDGSAPFAPPNAATRPTTEYGRQKASVEQGILALGCRTTVVRMPKVVSYNVPFFSSWLLNLSNGKTINPFSDLSLSPISLGFLTAALAMDRLSGIVHLSGASQVTYAEFASQLAEAIGAPEQLVDPITAKEMGVQLLFAPRYTTLDTSDTVSAFSIKPQAVQAVVQDLIQEFSQSLGSSRPKHQALSSATPRCGPA